jgi:fucose permease
LLSSVPTPAFIPSVLLEFNVGLQLGHLFFLLLTILQLEVYYNVNYTIISLVFLAPFLGYTLAAFLNNTVHMRFGQLGIAIIGPSCKIVAYVVICIHPPYPVLPVIFMFAGFGIGLADSGWNAWIGNMQNANEMLGILHGCYGLGAAISPLIATAMVTKAHLVWYKFYYLMVCLRQPDFSTESWTSHPDSPTNLSRLELQF